MANSDTPVIVWFRRDLRLSDNVALTEAAESGAPLLPLYILDDETPGDHRMGGASRWWLHADLGEIVPQNDFGRDVSPAVPVCKLWARL